MYKKINECLKLVPESIFSPAHIFGVKWWWCLMSVHLFVCRQKRYTNAYCSPDLSDFVQLVEEGDDRLFRKIINNPSHVLHGLLFPPTTAKQQYNLRRRPHDRQMPDHKGHLADKNFLIRILFKDSY